ncbi:MAG: DUF4398 domain-containing protein [Pseudomonadota bacterium]
MHPPRFQPRRATLAGLGILTLLALGACASLPPPTAQLAVSTAAVVHAAAATGQTAPTPELALARDKLQRANQALADKDHLNAGRLAQQAQVDALVAESRAETNKARLAAQEVQAAGRALTDELSRKKP